MAQQTINIGAAPDDGTGDTIRVGGDKINDNFTELYAADAALGTAAALDIDIDDTLAADSDSLIPTQQAVKAYVDNEIAGVGGGGINVEDEGVAEATGATILNFTGAGVTAADVGGGQVDITIPGGGAGGVDVEDEGVAEATGATTLNFTGAGVTATDMGAGVVDVDIPGGGGGAAWALAGTGQTATGVYDFAVDGAKATIDFAGLASFNELLIIGRGLSWTVSGTRAVQVSVDNGASFYTTSGDYISVSSAGAESSTTVFANHSTASAAARTLIAHILNLKGVTKYCNQHNANEINRLFVASASDINAVRFTNTAGGNSGAGTVHVYAR